MSTVRSISQFQRDLYIVTSAVAQLAAELQTAIANGDDPTDLITAIEAANADRPTAGAESVSCFVCEGTVDVDEDMPHCTVTGYFDGANSEVFDSSNQLVIPLCSTCITSLTDLKALQEVTDADVTAAKDGYMP